MNNEKLYIVNSFTSVLIKLRTDMEFYKSLWTGKQYLQIK